MKAILLKAMQNCANKYAKGFARWEHLWQEKSDMETQAAHIAAELELMGYRLLKIIPDKPAKVFDYPLTENECYE